LLASPFSLPSCLLPASGTFQHPTAHSSPSFFAGHRYFSGPQHTAPCRVALHPPSCLPDSWVIPCLYSALCPPTVSHAISLPAGLIRRSLRTFSVRSLPSIFPLPPFALG
jgi:hypothetical protein